MAKSYLGGYGQTTSGTVYIFPNIDLDPGVKYIVIGIHARKGGAVGDILNVGISGSDMTLLARQLTNPSTANQLTALFIAPVDFDTGTITVSFSETYFRCGISLYALTGINPVPYNTAGSNGGALYMGADVGPVIAIIGMANSNINISWPNSMLARDGVVPLGPNSTLSCWSVDLDSQQVLDLSEGTSGSVSVSAVSFSYYAEPPGQTIKLYDGTTWQDKPLKRWDEEQWVGAALM